MTKTYRWMAPLAAVAVAALAVSAPAVAQAQTAAAPATAAGQQAASAFIMKLADDAFAILRDTSLSRSAARAKFRDLLRARFAVDETGMRLIRRYRAANSPVRLSQQQLDAYRAALPDFLVNTYSDRLYDYAGAKVALVRTTPRGNRGDVDVTTRITVPGGGQPVIAVWQVKGGATPQVANITVNGVNVALTQEQDFAAYIDRNGFDALVDFMRKAG